MTDILHDTALEARKPDFRRLLVLAMSAFPGHPEKTHDYVYELTDDKRNKLVVAMYWRPKAQKVFATVKLLYLPESKNSDIEKVKKYKEALNQKLTQNYEKLSGGGQHTGPDQTEPEMYHTMWTFPLQKSGF